MPMIDAHFFLQEQCPEVDFGLVIDILKGLPRVGFNTANEVLSYVVSGHFFPFLFWFRRRVGEVVSLPARMGSVCMYGTRTHQPPRWPVPPEGRFLSRQLDGSAHQSHR